MKKNSSIVAKETAKKWHKEVNQTYGNDLPYHYHTDLVGAIANKYINIIDKDDREIVMSACYLHDTIEDCRKTYNDVKSLFGEKVADIVYAVTNEKGKTRKERANNKYYYGIRDVKYASFVKVCDRMANVLHGVMHNSQMLNKYKEEGKYFYIELVNEHTEQIFVDLHNLIENGIFDFSKIKEFGVKK